MADTYSNHVGTTADVWQLGGDGPQLKRSGPDLEVRSGDDTELVHLKAQGMLLAGRLTLDLVVGGNERFITEDLEIVDGIFVDIEDTGAMVLL